MKPTSVEQAIKKAIEGGWNEGRAEIGIPEGKVGSDMFIDEIAFADPLFWQSLGKAMGWPSNPMSWKGWKNQWHDFIDHLAEGKTAEEFFEKLLK